MRSSSLLENGGLRPSLGAGHVVSREGRLELRQALRCGQVGEQGAVVTEDGPSEKHTLPYLSFPKTSIHR